MSCYLKCSREEAINISLDEYSEKYFNKNQKNGINTVDAKNPCLSRKNETANAIVDIPPKPYQIRKFNHTNYWRCRKYNYRQQNTNQNRRNNKAAEPYRYKKSRWNTNQPYQQLLQSYNTLTKHLPSLLNMRISPPDSHHSYNVSNPNSTLVETAKSASKASIDQMSTLADQLLKKFDTLYEIRQSIKVEQEKRDKYNIPIQKEIASIQNKTLYVKCPNSEVVTSDGPGIELTMPVHSTNLSNNMRFA